VLWQAEESPLGVSRTWLLWETPYSLCIGFCCLGLARGPRPEVAEPASQPGSENSSSPQAREGPTVARELRPGRRQGVALVGVKWHGCPPGLSGPQRDLAPARPLGRARHLGLKIEIQEELEGDWSQVHRRQLAFPFVGEPGFNHVRGEHVTLEQPIVIPLQGVQHLT
jgi:hypothetical protein